MYENIREHCKDCKHYKKCSKNIYSANIERRYLILWAGRDCWESDK